MYKNYIFDIYGTLIDINTDEEKEVLWDKLALFYSFKGANYKGMEIRNSYNKKVERLKKSFKETKYPDFNLEIVFRELYEEKNVKASKELIKDTAQIFRALSIKYIKLYDGVIELLKELRNKDKKIYVLSNAQRVFTLYELKFLGIYEYFEDIFLSSDYNICKPEEKFYKTLIEKHNLNVKESVMIGNDYIADICGGKKVGLSTAYIHSNLSPEIKGRIKSNHIFKKMDLKKLRREIIR